MNLENLVLYVAFTMGKASSLDLSTDFCKSACHGGLVSHMQNVLTSTGNRHSRGGMALRFQRILKILNRLSRPADGPANPFRFRSLADASEQN